MPTTHLIVETPLPRPSDYRLFQDAPAPQGYETAYSYFSRTNPEAFWLLFDPVTAVAEEHPALLELTQRNGLEAAEVEAPTAVREFGVEKTLAFPVKVLRRFYR
ncbi:MAG: hypothetical protein K0M49_01585 [Arenimonas sp.]|nr:hypothetical protein [Rhizobium sp.]MBW8444297.1 hypothetical protein [Arenimonas sp.]